MPQPSGVCRQPLPVGGGDRSASRRMISAKMPSLLSGSAHSTASFFASKLARVSLLGN